MDNASEHDDIWPEVGELVVGTCTKVTDYGAYFLLLGFENIPNANEAGFVHISELSRSWVRNIRAHIREGQRVVARVLRVNPGRKEIDLSIRRVSDGQRRAKLQEIKQEQRARMIFKARAEECGCSEDNMERIMEQLLRRYSSYYDALLAIQAEGQDILTSCGMDEDGAQTLFGIVCEELKPPTVSLIGIANVTTYEPNGIKILTKAFEDVRRALEKKHGKGSVHASTLSSPKYRVMIQQEDWKTAEKAWQMFQDQLKIAMRKKDVEMSFEREKA